MKKKRRTKHRGNAAGQVQARGRTGRRSSGEERKAAAKAGKSDGHARRQERLDRPPTWRGALQRAGVATIFFFLLLVLFFRDQPLQGKVFIAVFMLAVYVPMGYYTDSFIYRRRQAKRARDAGGASKPGGRA